MGAHIFRKTFIGYSDCRSMKPYIDIVDGINASEMSKMNSMD